MIKGVVIYQECSSHTKGMFSHIIFWLLSVAALYSYAVTSKLFLIKKCEKKAKEPLTN